MSIEELLDFATEVAKREWMSADEVRALMNRDLAEDRIWHDLSDRERNEYAQYGIENMKLEAREAVIEWVMSQGGLEGHSDFCAVDKICYNDWDLAWVSRWARRQEYDVLLYCVRDARERLTTTLPVYWSWIVMLVPTMIILAFIIHGCTR